MFRRRVDLAEDIDAPGGGSRWRDWPAAAAGTVGRFVAAPWRWAAGRFGTFVGEGPVRRTRHLFYGLPALLAAAGFVTFLFVARHRRGSLAEEYAAAAAEEMAADDPAAAALHLRRLGSLGRTGPADRLRLAVALEEAGRGDDARELFAGLLGGDGDPGFAPAHLLFAERLLVPPDGPAADPAEAAGRRRRAVRHLAAARRAAPDAPAVTVRSAELHLRAGDPAAAAPLLEEVAGDEPAAWPDLVRVYAALGREGDARGAAAKAIPVLRTGLDRNPLDLSSRSRLADALARVGRFDQAAAVLEAGEVLHPDGNVPTRLAALHVAEYDRAVAAGDGRLGRRLELLRRAVARDPAFAPALERLANVARDATANGDPTAAEALSLLRGVLATGEAPAAAHFALGLTELAAGDRESAAFHFERAHALDPSLPAATNNLAFLLLAADPPDAERALELTTAAVTAAPDRPEMRETRGDALAALDRPAEALTEYERAMELGLRSEPKLRAKVADLYDRLGRPEVAAAFREPPAAAGE